jgi:hypothetical protein
LLKKGAKISGGKQRYQFLSIALKTPFPNFSHMKYICRRSGRAQDAHSEAGSMIGTKYICRRSGRAQDAHSEAGSMIGTNYSLAKNASVSVVCLSAVSNVTGAIMT